MLAEIGKDIADSVRFKVNEIIDEEIRIQPMFLSEEDMIRLKRIVQVKLYQKLQNELMGIF